MRHIQSFGLLAAIFVIAAGVVTCSVKTAVMWLFPMANTIIWLHYDTIRDAPELPVWCSFVYFLIVTGILLILNCRGVQKIEFLNIEHTE